MVVCTGLAICLSSGRVEQRLAICVGSKKLLLPSPAASYGKPRQVTINQTKAPTSLASHRGKWLSRENARKKEDRRRGGDKQKNRRIFGCGGSSILKFNY